MKYPWYSLIEQNDGLQQGDFIINCPVIIPPAIINVSDTPEVEIKKMDAVIVSQSCDLANKSIDNILVCRHYSLTEFLSEIEEKETLNAKSRKKVIENLRKGHFVSYHLLNKQDGVFDDYLVVDFKGIYNINRSTLNEIINLKTRKRLLPPYREHLSQAFARYFMRVGLPQDITIEGY